MMQHRIYQRFASNRVTVTIVAEGAIGEEIQSSFRAFAATAAGEGFRSLHEPRKEVATDDHV